MSTQSTSTRLPTDSGIFPGSSTDFNLCKALDSPSRKSKYKGASTSPEDMAFTDEFSWTTPYISERIEKQREEIRKNFEYIFAGAREEVFEDGMESQFSMGLVQIISIFGNLAIDALAEVILSEDVNDEIASEALRWLGHMDHPVTYRKRLRLLERSLGSPSLRIRDGAALGLSFLDDPHAIPYFKEAINQEPCRELRQNLEQVLSQLENA